jgi:hypothetical protein
MKKTFIIVLIGLACLITAPSANSETIINGVKEGGTVTESAVSAINHAATEKANLVNADEVTGQDSADSFNLIRTTWTSVKAFLKTYFDGLYATTANETFTGTHTLPSMAFTPLTEAPASPVAGTWYYADNEDLGWDPINYAGTANYWVIYDGANYIGIIDEDGVWLIESIALTPITFNESVEPSTDNLTAAQLSRGFVNNYGQAAAATLTLPAAAEGLTFVAIVGTKVAQDWIFDGNGAETIYTDISGTLTAGRAGIKCNNQEVGSRMSCATFQTGAASYSWVCGSISGTWTAVAP